VFVCGNPFAPSILQHVATAFLPPRCWSVPCAIFMSPEVACNRFYFVIVLVALPFVFFMCRQLPFGPFLFLACRPCFYFISAVVAAAVVVVVVAHFWGK